MNLSIASLFNRITTKDRAFFIRQLSVMVTSGVAISSALTLIAQQTTSESLKTALHTITKDVENGHAFSEAAARYPEVFDQVSLSMIRTGEVSGQLPTILQQMSEQVDKGMKFTNKVRNAMLYPAFVLVVLFIVGIIVTTVIIPKLTAIFEETSASLPWTTKLLIALSDGLIHYWYILVVIVIGVGLTIRTYLQTDPGKELFFRLQMRTPVVKSLIMNSYLARFTSVLSMLIKAGVPFTDSLHIVSAAMQNRVWTLALQSVRQEVERGIPLSAAMSRHAIFPATLTQMVAVGEQTGKLDSVLKNMATYYEDETNTSVKNVTTLIEPLILLVVAVGVGFVVVSVIVPIYGIAEQF